MTRGEVSRSGGGSWGCSRQWGTYGCAQLLCQLLLLVTAVNANDVDAHGSGVLNCQTAQPAASSNNGYCLAGLGSRFLQSLVDGDTCAEDGGNLIERNAFWDVGHMSGRGNGILLEGSINGVAGEFGGQAEGFVGLLTEGAAQARVVQPLDANGLANLADLIGDELSSCDDNTSTLMATDQG